jgi:hypothetical protein
VLRLKLGDLAARYLHLMYMNHEGMLGGKVIGNVCCHVFAMLLVLSFYEETGSIPKGLSPPVWHHALISLFDYSPVSRDQDGKMTDSVVDFAMNLVFLRCLRTQGFCPESGKDGMVLHAIQSLLNLIPTRKLERLALQIGRRSLYMTPKSIELLHGLILSMKGVHPEFIRTLKSWYADEGPEMIAIPEPPEIFPYRNRDLCESCVTCYALSDDPKKCGKCGTVQYCDKTCSWADWYSCHKQECGTGGGTLKPLPLFSNAPSSNGSLLSLVEHIYEIDKAFQKSLMTGNSVMETVNFSNLYSSGKLDGLLHE